MAHQTRAWIPTKIETNIADYENQQLGQASAEIYSEIQSRIAQNRQIHEQDCINLNPGTNAMNPRAEAVLSHALGRPSLGYPGDKYEMGLEGIERIEILANGLACEVFQADYAEIRVASGAIANLYAFMATTKAGDTIITPPPSIAGHVTHHNDGAAGLYGLNILYAPIDPETYTVDLDALREMAQREQPRLITIGGSLNLNPHPVAQIREIADSVGAKLLFDAAHLSGIIAGKAWENPLHQGAHLMTMSTYKSLGGPASGLLLTNDAEIAQRLDAIAYPGMTANFDAAKSASLAITLLDWRDFGREYAQAMVDTAQALAQELEARGLPVFRTGNADAPYTQSHQFALKAGDYGGGQTLAKRLRQANILSCGIGLPIEPVDGDVNGLRLGTNEIVRWGMTTDHVPQLAEFIVNACQPDADLNAVASQVTAFRRPFQTMRFIHSD